MPAHAIPAGAQGLVTILANSDCPHCVHATDTLTAWCCDAGLPVAAIDLSRHPEVATERNVEHSPSVVYQAAGGPRIFPGFPSHEEFDRLTH